MPFVNTDNAKVYYETHGEGPPVVLAHGAGGNTLVWWQQIAHFARRHKVVAFDHRGWGRSQCAPEHKHARYFADDMRAVMTTQAWSAPQSSASRWVAGPACNSRSPTRSACHASCCRAHPAASNPERHQSARSPRSQPHDRPRPPDTVE